MYEGYPGPTKNRKECYQVFNTYKLKVDSVILIECNIVICGIRYFVDTASYESQNQLNQENSSKRNSNEPVNFFHILHSVPPGGKREFHN